MLKSRLTMLLLLLMAIPGLTVVGLVGMATLAGGSAGGTLSTGRRVMAYSDSIYVSSTFSKDTVTIKTGGKTIVVQPTRLIVDGANVASLDEKTAAVQVWVNRGTITLVADGQPVLTRMR